MKLKTFILFTFLLFLFVSCNKQKSNTNDYARLLREHPSTNVLNYPLNKGDWTDRVYNIDESRISYIIKMNEIDGFNEIPISSTSSDEMKLKLKSISASLHPKIKQLFDKYVFALYFCEKLGGTGITGFVYNNVTKKPVGGFIVIDSEVIQKKANDWITFKERSVFNINDITLEIRIEQDKENTVENALRYILLHEMGHVISNTLLITPDLREETSDYSLYPFLSNVWISLEKTIYDQSIFPARPTVLFYASESAKLNLDKEWSRIYPILGKTKFPTLYAATNALDHFAETFVSYIHCIIDSRPWELTLTRNGKVIYEMKNRIHEMDKEKEFLRRIIFQ